MIAPNLLSLNEALSSVKSGQVNAEQVLAACATQIARLNPKLNAFITLAPELEGSAQERAGRGPGAAAIKQVLSVVAERPLRGLPIAVKDLFETAHLRTTGGSRFFKDYLPAKDATVIKALRGAGATIVGKTNTHEIALGVTTQNPHFGSCRNPWDETRIPGGSSGGSAVAVSTGMAPAALGTDTGGSIRIPASLCGVVGLKPTYGRVSTRGVIPLSWNLDHVGPIATTVEDAALLLQLIAGYDVDDPCSVDKPTDDYAADLGKGVKDWRIALAIGEYVNATAPEISEAVNGAARILEGAGAIVEPVDVTFLREAALANGIMTQADAAAFHKDRLAEHPEWFGEDVRARLEAGRNTTSTEYSLARHAQLEMKRRLDVLFEVYEVLLLPTTSVTAPRIEGERAVEEARRLTRFTAPFNLTGVPALTVPCGLSSEGLPMGLQIVTRPWHEARLLRAGFAYEAASGHRPLRPPLALQGIQPPVGNAGEP